MIMKAAYITIHLGFNFGSVFQTIATQIILKKAGCEEVECVNYIPPRVRDKRYWEIARQSKKRFLRRLLFYPVYYYSKYNFGHYLRKKCNLSDPIYAEDNFLIKCPKADVYVSGSDQIWNYKHNEGNDKHYFFDGIKGRKIAYASSIGMEDLPQDYGEYMKNQLQNYHAISVREESAVGILKKWGIPSIQLLDPTLMLNKDEWRSYASKRIVRDPYLFVYLPYNISDKESIYKSIRIIASTRRLKVISYSESIVTDKDADETIKFVDPGDILSLFYYADMVVTNSFHGTAFSINLNKDFWVYMPSNFSTRINSILDLFSLKNRLLTDVINENQLSEMIDYNKSNQTLDNERIKAINYLTNALK